MTLNREYINELMEEINEAVSKNAAAGGKRPAQILVRPSNNNKKKCYLDWLIKHEIIIGQGVYYPMAGNVYDIIGLLPNYEDRLNVILNGGEDKTMIRISGGNNNIQTNARGSTQTMNIQNGISEQGVLEFLNELENYKSQLKLEKADEKKLSEAIAALKNEIASGKDKTKIAKCLDFIKKVLEGSSVKVVSAGLLALLASLAL